MSKNQNSGITETTNPKTIDLVRQRKARWMFQNEVKHRRASFEKLGFVAIGDYCVSQMPGVTMAALIHQSLPLIALVSEHPVVGCWSEVDARYDNGDGLTVTNAPMAGVLDQMPGQRKIALRGKDEKTLFASAVRNLKIKRALTVTEESLPALLKADYEREMAWRTNKGVNGAEVRRVASANGGAPDDNTLHAVVKTMNKDYEPSCIKSGECIYQKNGDFEGLMELMPNVPKKDSRCCPVNKKLCLDFMGQAELLESQIPNPISIERTASMMVQNPLKPIPITEESGELKKAITKAQTRLDQFLLRLGARVKSDRDFMVRVRFKQRGLTDYVWVKSPVVSGKRFSGLPTSESDVISPIKVGKRISFNRDDVTDWAFRSGKYWQGHFTGPVLIKRIEKAVKRLEKVIDTEVAQFAIRLKTIFSPDFQSAFNSWLDKALAAPIAPEVIAFSFNLAEAWCIEVIGAATYSDEDSDWACDEAFRPKIRHLDLPESEVGTDWETVLESSKKIVGAYLARPSAGSAILKKATAVVVGFVDGDLHRVWPR